MRRVRWALFYIGNSVVVYALSFVSALLVWTTSKQFSACLQKQLHKMKVQQHHDNRRATIYFSLHLQSVNDVEGNRKQSNQEQDPSGEEKAESFDPDQHGQIGVM